MSAILSDDRIRRTLKGALKHWQRSGSPIEPLEHGEDVFAPLTPEELSQLCDVLDEPAGLPLMAVARFNRGGLSQLTCTRPLDLILSDGDVQGTLSVRSAIVDSDAVGQASEAARMFFGLRSYAETREVLEPQPVAVAPDPFRVYARRVPSQAEGEADSSRARSSELPSEEVCL